MIQFEVNGFDIPLQTEADILWLQRVAHSEGKELRELNIQFLSDESLHKLNIQFLNHHTYTDIITFDRCRGDIIKGDLAISWERVMDNATEYQIPVVQELRRVMVHGLLHLCGYGDKSDSEIKIMRSKELHFLTLHPSCSTWNID